MLHRSRLRRVRLRIVGGARFGIDHERAHAACAKLVREHQAARPGANNQNVGLDLARHRQNLGVFRNFFHAAPR